MVMPLVVVPLVSHVDVASSCWLLAASRLEKQRDVREVRPAMNGSSRYSADR